MSKNNCNSHCLDLHKIFHEIAKKSFCSMISKGEEEPELRQPKTNNITYRDK